MTRCLLDYPRRCRIPRRAQQAARCAPVPAAPFAATSPAAEELEEAARDLVARAAGDPALALLMLMLFGFAVIGAWDAQRPRRRRRR